MSKYDMHDASPQKEDTNCRTCTDFKSWSKKQKELFINIRKSKNDDNSNPPPRTDCPLDKSELGNATWGLLHTMAATYADNPTDDQQKDIKKFYDALSRVYPCDYCAKDFRKELRNNPVDASSQRSLSQWLCKLHNRVNAKLGKPLFDCSRVNERWRDGWLDGSCD